MYISTRTDTIKYTAQWLGRLWTYTDMKNRLIPITTIASRPVNIVINLPFLKSPIMVLELVNVSMGMRANGSCRLINTFNMSFIMVRSCIPENVATRIVGKIAMLRVNKTRTQRFHLRFKKPSITNCPV